MRVDVDTLVGLVARVARFDENGERTDVLFKQIEEYVIQECDDPGAYAQIGRKASEGISGFPVSASVPAVLAELADFCGIRRLPPPPSEAREQYLLQLIEELEKAISALSESPIKNRCQSLFDYHRSIFYGDYGHFDKAAEMQRQSARVASRNGDLVGMAIGQFMEAVFNLKQGLFDGDDRQDVLFDTLAERFKSLSEKLRGSPMETLWAEGNGPVFMLQACVWLDNNFPGETQWFKTIISVVDELGDSWKLIGDFVRAVYTRDVRLLQTHAETNDDSERRATCLLILARQAILARDSKRAKGFVGRMPREPSVKHVVAIANRLLEQ
jgi:hypothetical protein